MDDQMKRAWEQVLALHRLITGQGYREIDNSFADPMESEEIWHELRDPVSMAVKVSVGDHIFPSPPEPWGFDGFLPL